MTALSGFERDQPLSRKPERGWGEGPAHAYMGAGPSGGMTRTCQRLSVASGTSCLLQSPRAAVIGLICCKATQFVSSEQASPY